MTNISLISPSRNNLKYLKWSYESVRRYLPPDIEYCVASDYSQDGTPEWCEEIAAKDPHFKYIVNDGTWFGENQSQPTRMGHTLLYDKLINEVSTRDIVAIWHADMFATPGMIDKVLEALEPGKVVSLTRVEPELHPPGPEKILKDFGTEPENFDGEAFLEFAKGLSKEYEGQRSEGIFAPWFIYKKDFQAIGGHDPLYRPQSREDSIPGDRFIFIINDNTGIELVSIEELFNRYENLQEIRDDGAKIIQLKENGINVATTSALKHGKIGRNYIRAIIKKKNVKELVKVNTHFGETICTIDHSLLDRECRPIKPNEVAFSNIWNPDKLNSWVRRNNVKRIDFNEIPLEILTENGVAIKEIKFPVIEDIDEYGMNLQLINICEFLGYFVAEGSTHIDYDKTSYNISICSNDLDELEYFKNKSLSLFPNLDWGNHVVNKKDDCKDVYKYGKSSKILAHFMRELVGGGSKNKQVPNIIFNLPKAYQEAFLYGYLKGDGYLGTRITRQAVDESFSVDKRLMFNKEIFPNLQWKSTSKSPKLTAGINYLLRKNFNVRTSIHYSKERDVYNIHAHNGYRKFYVDVDNLGVIDCDVYDLEVERSHTFVDAMGFVGLHNSDIFNRFILNGYETIQLKDTFVYHLTCRGSRFNPTLTRIGNASAEWKAHNRKSERNFIRKWGHMVKTDENLKPIVPPKYKVVFSVKNCTYPILETLEPWCDKIYADIDKGEIERYIYQENINTDFVLRERVFHYTDAMVLNGVLVEFDAQHLNNDNAQVLFNLSSIIEENHKNGLTEGAYEFGPFKVTITDFKTYEKDLVVLK